MRAATICALVSSLAVGACAVKPHIINTKPRVDFIRTILGDVPRTSYFASNNEFVMVDTQLGPNGYEVRFYVSKDNSAGEKLRLIDENDPLLKLQNREYRLIMAVVGDKYGDTQNDTYDPLAQPLELGGADVAKNAPKHSIKSGRGKDAVHYLSQFIRVAEKGKQ